MKTQTHLSGVVLLCLLGAFSCSDNTSSSSGDADGQSDAAASGSDASSDDGTSTADSTTSDSSMSDSGGVDVAEQPIDVTQPGPYNVGFGEWFVDYTPDDSLAERSLRVVFWYPTEDESGTSALYAGLVGRPEAFQEAAISEDGPFPVLVFSHGNQGIAEQSYFFTEFLASHGWIVVAPEHTGNTAMNATTPFHLIMDWRPQDISTVIDTLQDLDDDHPLFGHQSDELVVSGHSFGGFTTLAVSGAEFATNQIESQCAGDTSAACDYWRTETTTSRLAEGFLDDRVDAAIPMAPWSSIFLGGGFDDIEVPTLLITGEMDGTTTNLRDGDPVWDGLAGSQHMRIDFATAGHFTFSNACDFLPSIGLDDGCADRFIEPSRAHQAINSYALAFLRYHLWGDESNADILDGTTQLETDITLSTKGDL